MPPKKQIEVTVSKIQLNELAKRLRGTRNNVYLAAQEIAGRKVGAEIFKQLEDEADLFRCVECSEWQDVEDRCDGDICQQCIDRIENDGVA